MPKVPSESQWSNRAAPDFLNLATSVLAREASRLAGRSSVLPVSAPALPVIAPPPRAAGIDVSDLTKRRCPVTGAMVQPTTVDPERLREQAQSLVTALLPGQAGAGVGAERASPRPAAAGLGSEIHRLGALVEPVVNAGIPIPPPDMDLLRRQAHEFIESLLVTFSQATGEKAAPYEDQVPLIRCAAPVRAGSEGFATMGVANDETTPCDVSLYCTNFIADSGYEIPSLRVNVSPRTATLPPGAEATFSIKIVIPQQTPPGTYSGLVQATGSKYVKAVLSVEVL